jgi:hypothetical protein
VLDVVGGGIDHACYEQRMVPAHTHRGKPCTKADERRSPEREQRARRAESSGVAMRWSPLAWQEA